MRRLGFFLLCLLLSPVAWSGAQEKHGDQTPEVLREPLPAPYQDDRILPGSVSPGGRYGLLYPKEEILSVIDKKDHLLLVALNPFRVLTEVSPDISLERGHSGYSVSWARDASAVLINVQAKWGPERMLLLPIRDGRAREIINLVPLVKKLVRPFYLRAKATRRGEASVEPFNDEVDFIFERDYEPLKSQEFTTEAWSAGTPGKVTITCYCTNNPKIPDIHTWAVRFDGVWDITHAKFTRQNVSLLHPVTDGQ